jgi:hypothetical protein
MGWTLLLNMTADTIERQEKWHADLLRREDCESRE